MRKTQKVTFDSNAKPPNHGPMKLHTKRKKRVIMATDNDANGLYREKDIVLVISQTCVTREKAIAALLKNDGDIVNAIMELV
jgi:NACalpha-BTF3-like transcription factor